MSKRLQVVLQDSEYEKILECAKTESVTLSEWVRFALRKAGNERSVAEVEAKLDAIRTAAEYSFPSAEIKNMLSEVERGYLVNGLS